MPECFNYHGDELRVALTQYNADHLDNEVMWHVRRPFLTNIGRVEQTLCEHSGFCVCVCVCARVLGRLLLKLWPRDVMLMWRVNVSSPPKDDTPQAQHSKKRVATAALLSKSCRCDFCVGKLACALQKAKQMHVSAASFELIKPVDHSRITPQSLFSGPTDQFTWMFTLSLIQEWSGRVSCCAVRRHYANGLWQKECTELQRCAIMWKAD